MFIRSSTNIPHVILIT